MRRLPGLLALLAAAGFAALTPARASIDITIDKTAQQMTVTVDGDPRYIWPVATGIARHDTPSGQYTPFRMEKDHFSREWDDAPMPYSIFFTKQGHAIHGTNHKITGEPASHGCVRLSVSHAAQLWALVKAQGMANVRVALGGHIPSRSELMARGEPGSDANADRDPGRNYRDPRDARDPYDDDRTGDIPPPPPEQRAGAWREYREGGRVYYYRDGPDEIRRLPPPPRRGYRNHPRYGGFPYW